VIMTVTGAMIAMTDGAVKTRKAQGVWIFGIFHLWNVKSSSLMNSATGGTS